MPSGSRDENNTPEPEEPLEDPFWPKLGAGKCSEIFQYNCIYFFKVNIFRFSERRKIPSN